MPDFRFGQRKLEKSHLAAVIKAVKDGRAEPTNRQQRREIARKLPTHVVKPS